MEQEGNAAAEEQASQGYWCVVCGREIPLEDGIYVHDDVPGHEVITFDEEERPQ